VADGSPSAKGSLENYLVPSQGENDEDPVRPDLVRRKLGLDIGSSVDNGLDKQPVSLAPEVQRSCATRAGIENEVSVVDDSVQEKNLGDFEHGGEKSELKQFKAELFSLYCG
jgi:DNA polymerase theta